MFDVTYVSRRQGEGLSSPSKFGWCWGVPWWLSHCHDPGGVPDKTAEILPAVRCGHQQQQNKIKKKIFFSLICSWATTQDVFHKALPMKQFSELYLVQLRFAEWELKLFMRTELLVNELAFCSYTSEYWMFTSRDVAFMIQETFWALGICFSWSKSYVLSPTNVSFPILHWKKKSLCLQYGNRWLIVCSQVNLFVSPPKASLSVTMIKSFSGWTRQRQVMGISPGRWFPGFRAEREMEHSWRMTSLSLWKVTCPFQLHESHPGFLVAL